MICNKTVTFFLENESVLRRLCIWYRERSQKRGFIFGRITLQTKREKCKFSLSNFVPVLLCIIDDISFNERLNSKCFLSFQQNSIYRCNIASFSRHFKKVFKDQFQAQIGNNVLKNSIAELTLVKAV